MTECQRTVQAYVAFAGPDRGAVPKGSSRLLDLWNAHSDKEFSHCTVFLKASNVDIYCELQIWHSALTVEMFTPDFVDDTIPLSPYTHVIKCDLTLDLRPYRVQWGVSCVSLVKHALGICKPMIVTPKQLYRYLKSLPGCTEIEMYRGHHEGSEHSPENPS